MADNPLLELVSGTVSILVIGPKPETLLNLAMARGIHVWKIRYRPEGIELKLRSSAVSALENLAAEHGYELKLKKNAGMPVYKKVFRRRLGFICGLFIFLAALWLMSSSIWFIQIVGNEKVDSNRIIASAARHGFHRGAMKWEYSRRDVEEDILRDISSLSYVEIKIQGVRAEIKVVEKILPPENERAPAHLVARCDGVIDDILLLQGMSMVKSGQTVRAGEVLISGIVMPRTIESGADAQSAAPMAEPKLVRAKGMVKARVWYEAMGECQREQEMAAPTGKTIQRLYWDSHGEFRPLWGTKKTPFFHYDTIIRRWPLPFTGGEVGLQWIRESEQSVEKHQYSESEAFALARDLAIEELRLHCEEAGEVKDSWIELISEPGADLVKVKLVIEVIEDIGEVRIISDEV